MKHDFFKKLIEDSNTATNIDKKNKKKLTDIEQQQLDASIRSQMDESNNFFQDENNNNGLDKTNSNTIESRTNIDKKVSKIPSDVMNAVKQRKVELSDSIDKFDNKGYNDHSLKAQAIECIDKIVELINNDEKASFDGIKSAQIYFGTLMGPLLDLLPAKLIKFIVK